jgi:hypothetical protein
MRQGETTEEAPRVAFDKIDDFYTFLMGTAREMVLVRDLFARKLAVELKPTDMLRSPPSSAR